MLAQPRPNTAVNDEHLDLGRLGNFIGFRLRRIQNQLSSAFTGTSIEHGLRPGEFSALAVISANPGLSQAKLAREVGLDKSAAVAVVDDLERLHFAERQRSPGDRRRHALYTTAGGEAALEKMFSTLATVERDVLNVLGPHDLQILSGLLDRVYDSCFRK
ncbi:MarR family winged helix-turn-helix transcriptional regulator [Polymorphobacter sp. PAMC 29334]|uniref:MarR family winged helix-turn-helix transcriptional regulator n=1 Tax=Polymorphobacter sp. PAMC 29334 TaxID=2862331 RepID=UPI001C666A40|nr:MarR family winged helix-turn-helix transcriptional regulator [Polymorphobacter sp. PAMC 29334]QYE35146.1 MarR family winged helix-turn-helix transcriptional regulator [Polymorphobacter sp. PAMC 29334]